MRLPFRLIVPLVFAGAAILAVLGAAAAARLVEGRSIAAVRQSLAAAGLTWVEAQPDGLLVRLSGMAPSEADRFRAISTAGAAIDPSYIRDGLGVAEPDDFTAPDFTVEVLRNDDSVSLIGLVPDGTRDAILDRVRRLAGDTPVTDLLETARYPVPETWGAALDFGLAALADLPRSKISITATGVEVTAITDSQSEKARVEADLERRRPEAVALSRDISAPRPVIAPFTLRFLVDDKGARFDACSANNERTRDKILAAAVKAGAAPNSVCTIGLGVPSPEWADATSMGIAALAELGGGSITFTDADVSLIAAPGVDEATFDRVVGELESNLPEVFSLRTEMPPKPDTSATQGPPLFTATLGGNGQVQLRGRITDELSRDSVESYARSRFGSNGVYTATRIDPDLPEGWPLRVLVGLEALAELSSGSLTVQPDEVRLTGTSGAQDSRDTVARILASGLGEGAKFTIDVRYDPKLDPLLGLPTPEECVSRINDELAAHKLAFEPGSATFTADSAGTLDRIAELMKGCIDVPMEVAGHTDSQGREEMNLALSEDRAEAVVAALMERRIPTSQLTASGYGETVPIASNDTEAGRESNRRIEFRLLTVAGTDGAGTEAAGTGEAAGGAAGAADPAATAAEPIVVEVQAPDAKTLHPRKRPKTN